MKIICLNIQDCGFTQNISPQELAKIDLSQPFSKCPLCGYYTILTPKNVDLDVSLETFKKLYKEIRKNE